ncbi:hypothetical protein [Hyphomonas sp.]|uniref:hypothetical protein n=1 Tax=Hyphomonas sp. TaxID=87 RepID=UPI002612A353|nr:hypothetical protein [Hyphomonas sp.]MDF1807997.1 hypothetical protein [Hyphomonas sp.]
MATAYILLAAWVVLGGGVLKLYLEGVENRLLEVSRLIAFSEVDLSETDRAKFSNWGYLSDPVPAQLRRAHVRHEVEQRVGWSVWVSGAAVLGAVLTFAELGWF